jgi:hypothetical protein
MTSHHSEIKPRLKSWRSNLLTRVSRQTSSIARFQPWSYCCIYGPPPWRTAYGLQLGWCIISFRWWSFQTQLEMPAECACMRTRHTLNTVYIRSLMYLYFRIQASSNQYISTHIHISELWCQSKHLHKNTIGCVLNPVMSYFWTSRINPTQRILM